MKYKYLAYTLLLALTSALTQAQVKIGNNPTTITPGALLDIEGSTTTTRTVSLTNGNLGIMTNSPIRTLDVNGNAGIRNNNYLEFGLTLSGKEFNAGKVGYELVTTGALDIIGAGGTSKARNVKLWDNVLINESSFLEFGHAVAGKESAAGRMGYGLFTLGALDIIGAGGSNGTRYVKLWDKLKIGGGGTPITTLDIEGNVRIADGTQGVGKILTSDGNGIAHWESGTSAFRAQQVLTPYQQFAYAGPNVFAQVYLSQTVFDQDGGLANNRFTVKTPGTYLLAGSIIFDNTGVNSTGSVALFKNGVFVTYAGGTTAANAGNSFNFTALDLAVAGDYYDMRVNQNTSGSTWTVRNAQFYGSRVR